MRFRFGLIAATGVAAVVLAGCFVTDATTARRAETWGGGTSRDEMGKGVTAEAQSGGAQNIGHIPEQDLAGFWILADNSDRECLVELRIGMQNGAAVRSAVPTPECVKGMRNVAGWALADSKIVLFDEKTRQIGMFEAATTYRYQGEFTIATGASYPATFVRSA